MFSSFSGLSPFPLSVIRGGQVTPVSLRKCKRKSAVWVWDGRSFWKLLSFSKKRKRDLTKKHFFPSIPKHNEVRMRWQELWQP